MPFDQVIERARRTRRIVVWVMMAVYVGACGGHMLFVPSLPRPPVLVGEWIDVRHTTPGDTSLWVLRADGYDGSAPLVADSARGGAITRSEHRYGSWYFNGPFTGTSDRAICFARRVGRDGATCMTFTLDTISSAGSSRRRLIVHGYQGEHHTGDRELLERTR